MRIVSWNVNSIRSRMERVLPWLESRRPDVVALQETKATDDQFPFEALEAAGYRAAAFGQKTYNGVALLSRAPIEGVVRGMGDGEEDEPARLIAGVVEGIKIVDVYVPNGQSPESPQFPYKLAWFARLRRFLEGWAASDEPVIVLGDFNVAPADEDVHDPDLWRGHVHFHPDEHAALAGLLDWGLVDLLREHEKAGGIYTWWDYRQLAFPKGRGLRIDLALGTKDLAARTTGVRVDRDMRKGKKPSDHAPVFTFLDEPPRLEA